jgi:hypothetical protein
MGQLVSMAYPDYIRPLLLKETARIIDYPKYLVTKIANSQEFKILRRKSLFLSLSDGSHIDLFRRLNMEEISHEQICNFYDISENKAEELIDELKKDLIKILGKNTPERICFRNLFLLDDFSGSGKSCLREENGYKGKIAKVFNSISSSDSPLSKILDVKNGLICTVLYMATEQAIKYLETQVGGTENVRLGFANCALPLVLSHNTPNNSVALLWSYEYLKIRGLFPRVTRH